jgi:hypothetical protein
MERSRMWKRGVGMDKKNKGNGRRGQKAREKNGIYK